MAVIGCGNVIEAYAPLIEKLRRRNLAEAALACGREKQRAAARNAFPEADFTTHPETVIQAPDIDLVIILSSMPSHGPLVSSALQAGKHVLVEKPMSTSLAEAASLVSLARQTGRHLLCAPFTILSPTFQTIARRVQAGDIGKVCAARARYGWAGPDWNEWFYLRGGGCLFDLGVYSITTLTGILGPARRVMAMTGVAIPHREIRGRRIKVEAEDNAQVLLDFGGALFASVLTGFTLQQYRSPALEFYGTTGALQMLGDDWDPDGYELWQNAAGSWQLFKETTPDWPWTAGLEHLVECIREEKTPLVTPEHAFHVLEIMVKAKLSGETGQALALESRFTPLRFTESRPSTAAHLVHDRTREHAIAHPSLDGEVSGAVSPRAPLPRVKRKGIKPARGAAR